jgi:hypothetical protein
MASLNYLQPYIDAINEKAERLDVPTPVIDTLRETLACASSILLRIFSILTARINTSSQ